MAADCTAALSDRKVPRHWGCAAAEIRAMPGIMRPLITVNRLVEINSKAHKGKPSDRVVAIKGSGKSQAM